MALTKITHSMSSTPGILDNSDATAITIGSDESVTLTSTVTTTGLIVNTDADSSLSIADGGTNAIIMKAAAGDELYMGANNQYAIRLLSDGTNDVVLDNGSNLGIGVSPKDWKSDWHVLNIGPEASFYSQTNATTGIGENIYYNATTAWTAVTTGPSSIYQLSQGTHNFYTMASASAGATVTPLQRMLIDNAGDTNLFGNLQILKTGADTVVEVKGNSSYDAVLNLRSDQGAITTEGFQVWYDNSVGDVHLATTYNHDNAAIRFHTRTGADKVGTGTNERLTIYGNGHVSMPSQPHWFGSLTNTTGSGSANFQIPHPSHSRNTINITTVSSALRWIIPRTGVYVISLNAIGDSAAARVDTRIKINGGIVSNQLSPSHATGTNQYRYRSATLCVYVQENDYVQFEHDDWYDAAGTGFQAWRTASLTMVS